MFFFQNKKKKVILHIGLPKTGSTALQQTLHFNRDELLRAKTLYSARIHKPQDPKHTFLIEALKKGKGINLADEPEYTKSNRVILSNEALANELYLHGADKINWLANSLRSDAELEVCIVLRDRENWLRSYYKQAIINQMVKGKEYYQTALTLDEFRQQEHVARLLNHDQLAQDTRDYFDAKTRVFHYEETPVAEIAQWCAGRKIHHAPTSRPNESLPDVAVEVMRQLNAGIGDLEEKYAWSHVLQRAVNAEHDVLRTLASRAHEETVNRLEIAKLESVHYTPNGALDYKASEMFALLASMKNILSSSS